ncbi:MAG: hypothetical protein IJ804_04280 [Prevotella sp.]|nr:hypothetical protein [Prevotella sp.]
MRKIYQLSMAALTLLTALTITSCTTSEEVTSNPSGKSSNALPKVVFKIKTPIGDPLVFTRGIADTDAEAHLASLWLYEIDAATDKIVRVTDVSSIISSPTSGSSDLDYEYQFAESAARELDDKDQLARRFVFVANDEPTKAGNPIAADDTYADLVAAIATKAYLNPTDLAAVPADDQSTDDIWNTVSATQVLPMSGDAVAGGSKVIPIEKESAVINTTVELTRAVARIDVVNLTPDLIITGMKLMKSNTNGYLIPQVGADNKTLTYAAPASVDEASNITVSTNATTENFGTVNAVNVFTPIKGLDGNVQKNASGEFVGAKRSMAFYIYEGTPASYVSAENEAMHLQVYGTLFDGVPVYYNIPFTAKYNKDLLPSDAEYIANAPVTIKRNNVYTVEIGDGYKTSATTDVKLSFSIANWNVQKMKEDIDTEIFKYRDLNDANTSDPSDNYASTETGRDPYEKANYVINIPATSNAAPASPLEIYVSEDYSNVQIKKVEISQGTGWSTGITADDATEKVSWLRTTLKADASSNSGKIVQLVADAMPALLNPAKRDISFRITYDINDPSDPSTPLTAGITQVFNIRQDAGDKLAFTNNGSAADDGVYSYEDEVQYISFGKYGNTNAFTITINDNAATPANYTDISDISIGGVSLMTADGTQTSDWLTVTMASTTTVSLTAAANTINSDARSKTLTITYDSGKTVSFVVEQERGDRLALTNDGTTGDATNGTFTLTAGTNAGVIDFTAAANVNPYIIAVKDQTISAVSINGTPVAAGDNWTLAAPNNWLKAEIINGKLNITVTANDTGAARSLPVVITYGDAKTVTFTVNQPAA